MNFWARTFRREELARALIAQAIAAHARYEAEHSERQGIRLKGRGPSHELVLNPERHGAYDAGQTRLAVYQRVVRAYNGRHPRKLRQWIDEALDADP